MNIEHLSDDELIKLYEQKQIEETKNNNLQMAMKIL